MLLRQTLLYFPAQFLGPVFQFVSILTWTHYLTPEHLGLVALVTAVQELALAASLAWFTHYTLRYAASFEDAERKAYLDAETLVIALSGAATLLIVLTMPLFVGGAWDWPLVAAAIFQSVGRVTLSQLADRSRAWSDPLSYSILQIGWPVGGFLVALALVVWVAPTATMVLLGYAIAQALAIAYVLLFRIETGRHPTHASREVMRKAARYAAPLVIGTVLLWVANNATRFVVEWRDGAAAVGLVTVGWSIGLRIASVAAMVVSAAGFPLALVRTRDDGIAAGQAQLVRNGLLLAAMLVPSTAGLWMIADELVPLFVGEAYREITLAILPASILAGAARNFRVHWGEQVFLLHERPVVPLLNDVVDAAAALVLGAVGLWLGDLPGLITGSAIGAVLSLVVTMAWGWRDYRYALPVPDVAKIALATALMAAVVAVLPIARSLTMLVLAVSAGAAVYAMTMAALYPAERRKAVTMLAGLLGRKSA